MTNIVAQKYFRGRMTSPEREMNVGRMIGRVVDTVVNWGQDGGYFVDEEESDNFDADLLAILIKHLAVYIRPSGSLWSLRRDPQCSA